MATPEVISRAVLVTRDQRTALGQLLAHAGLDLPSEARFALAGITDDYDTGAYEAALESRLIAFERRLANAQANLDRLAAARGVMA